MLDVLAQTAICYAIMYLFIEHPRFTLFLLLPFWSGSC
jgi:hypothetical protein